MAAVFRVAKISFTGVHPARIAARYILFARGGPEYQGKKYVLTD
jgi:hypothetical protein